MHEPLGAPIHNARQSKPAYACYGLKSKHGLAVNGCGCLAYGLDTKLIDLSL